MVLADYFLGDGNGSGVLRMARRRLPAARCIRRTASGEDFVRPDAGRQEGVEFIRKPFEAEEILRVIQELAR